ncbi:hypothetical protein ACOMHN_002903 [Nucella lapillus]
MIVSFLVCERNYSSLYVKEFVHGDFGRTKPNLRTLLSADCDILALDVTAVNIDWPPRIDPVPEAETASEGDNQDVKTDACQSDQHQSQNHCQMEVAENSV